MKYVVKKESIEVIHSDWGTLQWLITGKRGSSSSMTFGRVTIKPGMSNPRHLHPNCEEILYVESGEIEHTLPDGGTMKMNSGDTIVVPKGVWHHARNVGKQDAVVMVAFDNAWRETIGED